MNRVTVWFFKRLWQSRTRMRKFSTDKSKHTNKFFSWKPLGVFKELPYILKDVFGCRLSFIHAEQNIVMTHTNIRWKQQLFFAKQDTSLAPHFGSCMTTDHHWSLPYHFDKEAHSEHCNCLLMMCEYDSRKMGPFNNKNAQISFQMLAISHRTKMKCFCRGDHRN